MAKIAKSEVMRRAWRVYRLSLAVRFDRAAFADCLRQAWADLRQPDAPVTPWEVLQRYTVIPRTLPRGEVITRLESALRVAQGRAAQYARATAPRSWSAAKHRSADLIRVANIEAIVRAEKAAAGLAA
ncbi:hypothetical protein EZH22_23320 [Xanthobacter dioxanivorans]|uniref:Uncharacterized protein n=1 Tax=Xanthobacter dioxanivorans TaxID=2528964 RepID=A0A974SI87_9HYPH|nr:hypothetical protein [Xanthobacter dioxanivorans]QRG05919.1 hypothetical protein EZH22_23320 [Xanthobacter dioxanivorans]